VTCTPAMVEVEVEVEVEAKVAPDYIANAIRGGHSMAFACIHPPIPTFHDR